VPSDADEMGAAGGFGIRRSQNGEGSQGAEIFSFALTQRNLAASRHPCGAGLNAKFVGFDEPRRRAARLRA